MSQYKNCVANAFCPLLLGIQYSSTIPNQDRLVKFLSRLKEAEFDNGDPIAGLTTTELCKKGLPPNWCYVQYNRGPLQIVEEDEFREEKIRTFSQSRATFDEDRWGFGKAEINCWLVGNNGSATEAAETLFYINLYRIKSVDYLYLGIPWRSRVIHDSLATFEPLGLAEYGTGFTITWRAQLFVPVLRKEIEGFSVQSICNEVFDASQSINISDISLFPTTRIDLDLTKSVPLNLSIHSHFDESRDGVIIQPVEGKCNDPINPG